MDEFETFSGDSEPLDSSGDLGGEWDVSPEEMPEIPDILDEMDDGVDSADGVDTDMDSGFEADSDLDVDIDRDADSDLEVSVEVDEDVDGIGDGSGTAEGEILWDADHPDGGELDIDHGDEPGENIIEETADTSVEILDAEDADEDITEIPDMPFDTSDNVSEDVPEDVPAAAAQGGSALDDMAAYMYEHNYGRDDFAEYSRDPEWQHLNDALIAENAGEAEIPDMSDDVPEDLPEDVPEDVPADVPSDGIPDASVDVPEGGIPDVPADVPSDGVPDVPADAPVDVPEDVPSDVPADIPADVPEVPADVSEDTARVIDAAAVSESLSSGRIPDEVFAGNTDVFAINEDTRLEDLSAGGFDELQATDPERASRMMTEFYDRMSPIDDVNQLSRDLTFDDGGKMTVIDDELVGESATLRDLQTGAEYTVYPNPMDRVAHMEGMQGNNSLGMEQDCGIASTAKAINDLYGKNVTDENRLAEYAYNTGNCEMVTRPDGSIDFAESGGTRENNVQRLYEANGLDATAYVGDDVPTLERIGEHLKSGGAVTMAVNSDLLWNYDDAQSFDFEKNLDMSQYLSDEDYRHMIDAYEKMQEGVGEFPADHFINVSNAVYDSQGNLTHFIVSDTGDGGTKRIPVDALQRAYNGLGSIGVSNQGCVTASRRSS